MIAHRSKIETRIDFYPDPPAARFVARTMGFREWREWPHAPYYGNGVVKIHHPSDYRETLEFFDPKYPESILAVIHFPVTA